MQLWELNSTLKQLLLIDERSLWQLFISMGHWISWIFFCRTEISRLSTALKPSSGLFTIIWKVRTSTTPLVMVIRVQTLAKHRFCVSLPTHKSVRRMSTHQKRSPGAKRCPPREMLSFNGWYLQQNTRRMPKLLPLILCQVLCHRILSLV